MKKILIQAGHGGRTSGSTGAPEEQKWTTEMAPQVARLLIERGFEVKIVGADPSSSEIAGDWGLFLSLHYDADIYNDRGGFIDTPDPSVDYATDESNRIAQNMRDVYFSTTGIPNKPKRSNANTRYYYMWERMSAKTPCVIIEAGVGYRTPEDHKTLWFKQDLVAKAIATGIINSFETTPPPEPEPVKCDEYIKRIEELENENRKLADELKSCQSKPCDSITDISIKLDIPCDGSAPQNVTIDSDNTKYSYKLK